MKRKILLSPLIIIVIIILAGVSAVSAAIFIGAGSGTSTSIDLQKGLVGHWKMDGNAKDSTPYANNGTLTGNAAVTATDRKGQVNKAATFDGTGDYVDINNSVSLQINGDFSAEAWIKASTITQYDGIVSQYNNDAKGFLIDFANTNTLRFIVNPGTGEKSVNSGTINTGQWYHILVSISGTTLKFYQDGVLANTNSSGAAMVASTKNVFIGEGYTGGADFDGLIDDVRIYNRALSPTEITALYESYNPGIQVSDLQKGLVGHWKFDGNAKDATPNSNHGTLAGAAGANNLPQLTNDRKGQALKAYDFDGTDDYIDAGNGASLNINSGEITVETWIKINAHPTAASSYPGIVGNYAATGGYLLSGSGTNQSNKTFFFLRLNSDTFGNVSTNAALSTGVWHHVVGLRGSDNIMRIYVDAVQQTVTATYTNNFPASTNLFIGKYASAYINSSIDNVRVYNRALSPTEITALYQSYDPGIVVSDLQKGLVGQWSFDGDAKDRTPYGNNGTVTGATLTTDRKGQVNKAYDFNGSTDYIDAGSGSSLYPTDVISVFAWIKSDTVTPANYPRIVSTLKNDGAWKGYEIYQVISSGNIQIQINTGGSFAAHTIGTVSVGTWAHVGFTFDGTNIVPYFNGTALSPIADAGAITYTSPAQSLRIGVNPNVGVAFDGLIDEVRIYNRALSAAEVLALYESY